MWALRWACGRTPSPDPRAHRSEYMERERRMDSRCQVTKEEKDTMGGWRVERCARPSVREVGAPLFEYAVCEFHSEHGPAKWPEKEQK